METNAIRFVLGMNKITVQLPGCASNHTAFVVAIAALTLLQYVRILTSVKRLFRLRDRAKVTNEVSAKAE